MNEKEMQSLLMQVFGAALKGTAPEKELLTPESLPAVYALAKKHSLGHFVTRYVFGNGIATDPEMARKLQREELISVHQYERMQYTYREICQIFDEENIAYIPLKGSVLRGFYPDPTLRTSCDIDILIRQEELDRAVGVLKEKGYQVGQRQFHDIGLYSPNKIHLELHFNILENMDLLDSVLKDAWQYAVPVSGSRYEFRKEFFVFHMYAHMAYHFLAGGCGVRSLMDIWVMEHRMDAHYALAEELLRKAGIHTFAARICEIADICFEQTDYSDPILDYIWRGGTYGTVENHITVQKKDGVSSFSYIWMRIFLPYKLMVISYPILKKLPVLLPVCWVLRWLRVLLTGRSGRLSAEYACAKGIADDRLTEVKEMCYRLDL